MKKIVDVRRAWRAGRRYATDFQKGFTGAERFEKDMGDTQEAAVDWTKQYIKNLNFDKEEVKTGRKGIIKEAPDHLLRVGLFGAPNVGKSKLYNLLTDNPDHQLSLKIQGTTSDCKTAEALLGRMYFTAIDTPAIEEVFLPQILHMMTSVDLAFFIINVKKGVTENDMAIAAKLHELKIPTVILANKADNGKEALSDEDLLRISILGAPLYISASRRTGLGQLQDLIAPLHALREAERKYEEWGLEDAVIAGDGGAKDELADRRRLDRPLRIALVGQTNVGKSTLMNSLLGYSRAHVTPISGTTRDNITVSGRYQTLSVTVTDTPGFSFSKKNRWLARDPANDPNAVMDQVGYWMHRSTLDACRWSYVTVFVIDARVGLTKRIVESVEATMDLGRPVILVANKWDEVEDKTATVQAFEDAMKNTAECKHCTLVCVSAKNGTNMGLLMDTIVDHYRRWHTKISSGKLNVFWHKVQHALHIPKTRSKARHIVQLASSPPTFVIFLDKTTILQTNLARFMIRKFRAEFNLKGIPIRLIQRRKPPSVFKLLGYTNPSKVYKNPPTQMSVQWKKWEKGPLTPDRVKPQSDLRKEVGVPNHIN
eukprot:TRINITY_DN17419_c0_g1_i1.p1 TRINITY_DN17419_c0_g1~~TRINITY_DN17419_c0_g1_i1.p1  ORF type:complete len:613 (+),score=96.68 TRINITY_DN17419_c0_g1_i1:51-1841(+)